MKLLSVCLCIGILLAPLPAFAGLSVADLEQIRQIIKEENADLAKQMQAQIDGLHTRIDGLQTQIDMLFRLLLALIAFIAVVVGIPQIIVAMGRKKQREQDEKIEELQAEINELKQRWLVGT